MSDLNGKFVPLANLLAEHKNSCQLDENNSVGSGSHRDEDDDHMSSISVTSVEGDNILERLKAQARAQPTSNFKQPPTENEADCDDSAGCVPIIPSVTTAGPTTAIDIHINPNLPKGRKSSLM